MMPRGDFRAYMRELKDKEKGRIPPVTLSPVYDYQADKWDQAEDDYSEAIFSMRITHRPACRLAQRGVKAPVCLFEFETGRTREDRSRPVIVTKSVLS